MLECVLNRNISLKCRFRPTYEAQNMLAVAHHLVYDSFVHLRRKSIFQETFSISEKFCQCVFHLKNDRLQLG